MSFAGRRTEMQAKCCTCQMCFEDMSVLLQDDDVVQRKWVWRTLASDATALCSKSKCKNMQL